MEYLPRYFHFVLFCFSLDYSFSIVDSFNCKDSADRFLDVVTSYVFNVLSSYGSDFFLELFLI